ncbi:MAG: S9 family peptidase [Nitrospinae bacterium]|nr:S9 family peptidase [Nitrospinota bacterium]
MPAPIGPDAIYHLTQVSDPHLSPDGHLLAFVRSWVDQAAMEGRSRIMLMSLPDGRAEPFTQGARDSTPRFSPDGRYLTFLRQDDKQRRQIWVMPVHGGEARKLTDGPGGVSELAWSPDGQQLVFAADVDPDRLPEGHDPKKDPRVKVVRRIRYRFDTVGWRGDAHRHLFTIGLDGGPARQLTDGDWDDVSPVWSPDGTRIAFVSGRRPERDIRAYTEAYVVPVNGGDPQRWSENLYTVAALAWSPDATRLVAVASDDPKGSVGYQGWLFVLEPGKAPRRLTDDSIKPATGFRPIMLPPELRWAADGRVLLIADAHGQSYLYEVPASGGGSKLRAGGGFAATALSLDREAKRAVVAATPPDSLSELYLVDLAAGAVKRLTDGNAHYFSQHPPARLEKFTFQRNGLEIECRLWLPPDFDPRQRYPLLLDIHGGPNGAFYDAFNLVHQVWATEGYAVLAVNPRGSATYGNAFTMAVLGDWGGEDYRELMAAVDLVASRPYIDPLRTGVHGYSYGGFMTSWIVGHTERFKAAVVGAPCIDLPSMYGTSDIGVSFGEPQWGGTRQDAFAALMERSPLTYAAHVKTPVLLLHGEADLRCPIEQGEQFFVALKRLGKEVEFVRFPDCSHLFLRVGHPKMREEYLRRTLEWFDQHLKGQDSPSPKATTAQAPR